MSITLSLSGKPPKMPITITPEELQLLLDAMPDDGMLMVDFVRNDGVYSYLVSAWSVNEWVVDILGRDFPVLQ